MKIGIVGLGKLGFPVALTMESKGHTIYGYDIDENVKHSISIKKLNYKEKGAADLLKNSKIKLVKLQELVENSELIFVAIQTPHEKEFEGITRIPNQRKDFIYDYLVKGLKDISLILDKIKKKKP